MRKIIQRPNETELVLWEKKIKIGKSLAKLKGEGNRLTKLEMKMEPFDKIDEIKQISKMHVWQVLIGTGPFHLE